MEVAEAEIRSKLAIDARKRFMLNAAVTPTGSSYASSCMLTSFSKSVPQQQ
jgi:hypothetical protein